MSLQKFNFPYQVSNEQDGQQSAEIVFSNGATFSSLQVTQVKKRQRSVKFAKEYFTTQRGKQLNIEPASYPEYAVYSQRLRTFARWTRQRPGPTALSEAGFFFTNQDDVVRCYHCGIDLKNLSWEVDPLLEHVRNSEDCPFLLEHLGLERLSSLKRRCQTEVDVPTFRFIEGYTKERSSTPQWLRYPQYRSLAVRLSSFQHWPRHILQKPEDLADAGLFYTGVNDEVRCFDCGVGLRSWDPVDDPWTEHCRWFPKCNFAREKKGDQFIALVQASVESTNKEDERKPHTTKDENTDRFKEQMGLRDPNLWIAVCEHKDACLEMGFPETVFNEAVQELMSRGTVKPTIEDILDAIDAVTRKRQVSEALDRIENSTETPLEENRRLKSIITCMACRKNNVNALFLPCTHHRMCMACAEPLHQCPVCDRHITQKVKTYLA